MKYSIIIPAHNEAKRIRKPLKRLCKEFSTKDYEIIVVCNNCSDNTYEIVKSFCPPIKVLNIPEKIGKGGAIIEGVKIARGKIVGFTDADGAYSPEMIKKVIKVVEKNSCDCAIAKRWKNNTHFLRKLLSRVWLMLVKLLFNLPYSDTQAGLKFFKSKILRKVINEIECKNYAFDVELLLKVFSNKYKVKEVPVKSVYRKGAHVNLLHIIQMFLSLIKLKFKK